MVSSCALRREQECEAESESDDEDKESNEEYGEEVEDVCPRGGLRQVR